MKTKTLKDLFIHELQDAYSAETQLVKALPDMADAATTAELKSGFRQHLSETQGQVKRLEQVCKSVGCEAENETCVAMQGLIAEGQEMAELRGDDDVRDAGLIAAAQKVEHYEIALYGCLCTWAQELGLTEARRLLGETLQEEKATDAKLTRLAEARVNAKAGK